MLGGMEAPPDPQVSLLSRQERPRVGIVGAGRVGAALGAAIDHAGWPVVAVSSRDAGRRARFGELVPGARVVDDIATIVGLVDVLFLTVPDDVIASVAAGIRLRAGQAIVHTSGALPASVLASAQVPGTTAASFHPLVPFADTQRALAALVGATIGIEGDPALVTLLAELATAMGARPVTVSAAGKAAYHAAAVLAAGGFVALLDVIAELGRAAGLDERAALDTYAPLIRSALGNAQGLGIAAALTGPILRGDTRTIQLHLDVIDRAAPDARALYVAAAERQVELALTRGDLDPDRAAELRATLGP
jgi:predicted short-subunit dehydrogenase-like oxidoreductase (DUF2520 family)